MIEVSRRFSSNILLKERANVQKDDLSQMASGSTKESHEMSANVASSQTYMNCLLGPQRKVDADN